MRKFLNLFVWFLIVVGCTRKGASNSVLHHVVVDTAGIASGDIALRCGYGAESHLVADADSFSFSHVGLVVSVSDIRQLGYGTLLHNAKEETNNGKDVGLQQSSKCCWYVVHAVPGESLDGRDALKCEPIDSFFRADRAEKGGYAHISGCTRSQRLSAVRYALQKVSSGVLFDHDYSLSDTTRMYCTELVWQSYLHQGIDLTDGRRHSYQLPSTDGKFIFPSDMLASSRIKLKQGD